LGFIGAALVVMASACGDYGPVTLMAADAGDLSNLRVRGVGEACGDAARCRDGLVCNAGTCAPGRATDENQPCTISAECKDGLYCGAKRVCTRAGSSTAGTTCGSDADCASGLRCNVVGFSAECQLDTGGKDVGAACTKAADCFAGLLCTNKTCTAPAPATGSLPLASVSWNGADCTDEAGATKAYFRVPRGTDDGDFFRLPFPNDARRKNGRPDLSGFPTPGAEVLGYDLLDRWARYVEATADGFTAYPTMIVRFSGALDTGSVQTQGAVKLMDLTGVREVAVQWSYGTARSKYVCANALTARPIAGAPLEPGHTYALLVTNAIKANGGANVEVAADFKAVVGGADPGAPLSAAWTAYAPLRAWAASKSFDLGTLLTASVFTVGKHRDLAKGIADQVTAAPAPAVASWVKCGSAPSPCPDAAGDRACGTGDPAFDELHALVTLPVWQKGKAPYLAPEDGGDVAVDGAGKPVQQGTEQVCMSLTIPKGAAMPASGWPVAIWSHATGGSFRSAITDGVAKRLASADGGAASIAVLSIDGVAHGTRRGGSQATPASLWNATSNPQATRGRALQAASDVAALVRLASQLDVPANASPTGAAFKLGPVMTLGHDQGATATSLAAPYVATKGVALAGVSASFSDALRSKKQPVDFFDVAPVVLGETTLTPFHPALTILQNAIDPGDPLDHAGGVASQGKHVFVIYSQNDTFSTRPMQLAYTLPAGLGVANPPGSVGSPEDIGSPVLAVPAGGNVFNATTTAIVRQYAAPSYEGHTIVFRDADAIKDLDRFATDVALAKIPKVGR
jgi:hypothetical protein